jgi:uncharacterized protein with von Willebrand factor type A (vWA) domain
MDPDLRWSPCSDLDIDIHEMLGEVVKMQMGQGLDYDSKILMKARELADKRFEEASKRKKTALKELETMEAMLFGQAVEQFLDSGRGFEKILEELKFNKERNRIKSLIKDLARESQKLIRADLDNALKDMVGDGFIDTGTTSVKLTSRGARFLGQSFLNRILQNLLKRGVGPHRVDEKGHGPWQYPTCRPFEQGDPYERISVERSLLSVLQRGGGLSELKPDDFWVYEAVHNAEVQLGILVDQSGSMNREGKMEAAVETALALSELMRTRFPEDVIRVFAFSEEVREVAPWQLPDSVVKIGYTDIRSALRAFRVAVSHVTGNKQIYLVTDSAPNFEGGAFVGFERALAGVITEARCYRMDDIVLNLMMLDDDPELMEMAKTIAKQNLGRVFFTRPNDLGRMLVEDYFLSKRDVLRV